MIFEYVPVSTFILTVALIIYSIFMKQITELTVVLFSCVFLEMVHEAIKLYLMGFFDGGMSLDLLNFTWYFSFAVTDILVIFIIFKLEDFFKVTKGWLTKVISVYFVVMAAIQVIRYLDRTWMETHALGEAYQFSIEALNAFCACLLIGCVLVEAFGFISGKRKNNNLY